MTPTEIQRLLTLLSALPDGELRDLGMLAVYELKGLRSTLADLGEAINNAAPANHHTGPQTSVQRDSLGLRPA